ncbi:hypothetical protein BJV74DRAFT_834007 [Russula compacta]|nr:hypothetical protein BJV74DRAFT_834007 [Russula compacta]
MTTLPHFHRRAPCRAPPWFRQRLGTKHVRSRGASVSAPAEHPVRASLGARHHPARPCGSASARSLLSTSKAPGGCKVASSSSVAVSSVDQSVLRLSSAVCSSCALFSAVSIQSPKVLKYKRPSACSLDRVLGCQTPGRDAEGLFFPHICAQVCLGDEPAHTHPPLPPSYFRCGTSSM